MEITPRVLNERQAARTMCVSVAALRRWRREGRGPEFVHLERCVRYPVQAIERFLTENSSINKRIAKPITVSCERSY
jgi:predicted site-specific integrase-resolvase